MTQKKWKTKVGKKIIRHGAKGYRVGKPGSKKQKSYCARSRGIAKKHPSARKIDSANYQSRRKWKCKITKKYG